jgi:hypothetical protein
MYMFLIYDLMDGEKFLKHFVYLLNVTIEFHAKIQLSFPLNVYAVSAKTLFNEKN